MIFSEALREATFRLSSGDNFRDDARLVSDLLLCHVLECSRESLLVRRHDTISGNHARRFFSLIDKARSGIPVAYILKRKEFFGLDFFVDERVLIPRPETELLVEEALKICRTTSVGSLRLPAFSIADIGTGSACIAISLTKNLADVFPNVCFLATDISSDALEVARENVSRHGLTRDIHLIQSDLLSEISHIPLDMIVANLPYIGERENRFISEDVERTEPHAALFGGSDGLQLYQRLFEQISALSHPPKYILGEFGFGQADSLRKLLRRFFGQNDKEHFRIIPDLAGIERIFVVSQTFGFC